MTHSGIEQQIQELSRYTKTMEHILGALYVALSKESNASSVGSDMNLNVASLVHDSMGRMRISMPVLRIQSGEVYCDTTQIGVQNKPLIVRLFQVFLDHPHKVLDRTFIASKIYESFDHNNASERFRRSMASSVVKLVSRARLCIQNVAGSQAMPWIQWFPEVRGVERGWLLYQVAPEFLYQLLSPSHALTIESKVYDFKHETSHLSRNHETL